MGSIRKESFVRILLTASCATWETLDWSIPPPFFFQDFLHNLHTVVFLNYLAFLVWCVCVCTKVINFIWVFGICLDIPKEPTRDGYFARFATSQPNASFPHGRVLGPTGPALFGVLRAEARPADAASPVRGDVRGLRVEGVRATCVFSLRL